MVKGARGLRIQWTNKTSIDLCTFVRGKHPYMLMGVNNGIE
jgi:hypothetical protein